jgi:hypothetical protein
VNGAIIPLKEYPRMFVKKFFVPVVAVLNITFDKGKDLEKAMLKNSSLI